MNKRYTTQTITEFLCPFYVLPITLFIYYTPVPAGTEARTEVKYYTQGYGLARKG